MLFVCNMRLYIVLRTHTYMLIVPDGGVIDQKYVVLIRNVLLMWICHFICIFISFCFIPYLSTCPDERHMF